MLTFVYGTLKRGGRWHDLMTGAEFLGPASTVEKYPLLVSGLPYLLDRPGEGLHVEGELYRINDAILRRLDDLEEHPNWYCREERAARTTSGETLRAWMYFLVHAPTLARLEKLRLDPVASFPVTTRTIDDE